MQLCKKVFGSRLEEVVDIRGVHDWKNLLRDCRPKSADEDIQMQFSLQLRARADATIDVRSKPAVSASVPWAPWYQIMPHPQVSETALPASNQVPALAPLKSWPRFKDKVVPCLKRFYSRAFRHPVHIPTEERKEMLAFLESGPSPASAPAWIEWTRGNSESKTCATTGAVHVEPALAPASGPPEVSRKKIWRPFLAPRKNTGGKKCRCECMGVRVA